ncbi:hypothetical protein NQ317_005863 [Molorchus minor]|uniref:Uncharacterized protein n=1 Tax=Molorchus minor TaxID=1323400 RepID=A0ABQ9IYK6_9CUCU|nr:hypothetical protein NQ317_005863 [Molorchus minor]
MEEKLNSSNVEVMTMTPDRFFHMFTKDQVEEIIEDIRPFKLRSNSVSLNVGNIVCQIHIEIIAYRKTTLQLLLQQYKMPQCLLPPMKIANCKEALSIEDIRKLLNKSGLSLRNIKVPLHKTTLFQRSFSYNAVKNYNALPSSVKCLSSISKLHRFRENCV